MNIKDETLVKWGTPILSIVIIGMIFLAGCSVKKIDNQPVAELEYQNSIPAPINTCMELRTKAQTSAKTAIPWNVGREDRTIFIQIIDRLLNDRGFNNLSEEFKEKISKFYFAMKKDAGHQNYYILDEAGLKLLIESMTDPLNYIFCLEYQLAEGEKHNE